jgi:excisionase family DNA binding protein
MMNETQTNNAPPRGQGIRNPIFKRLYTLREAAEYLGRSVWSMRDLIWSGRLPVVKESGSRKIYIDIVDLEAFVNKNKEIYH